MPRSVLLLAVLLCSTRDVAGSSIRAAARVEGSDVVLSLFAREAELTAPQDLRVWLLPLRRAPLAVEGSRFAEGGLVSLYLEDSASPAAPSITARGLDRAPLVWNPLGADRPPHLHGVASAATWAFWAEPVRVRGTSYRALHIRTERAVSDRETERWRELEVRLAMGSEAAARTIIERLAPRPRLRSRNPAPHPARTGPRPYEAPGFRLGVDTSGIHEVTVRDLRAAGLAGDLPGEEIALAHAGRSIPFWLRGGDDGLLNADDDALLFFADPEKSVYTRRRIYWLYRTPGEGREIRTRGVGPAGPEAADTGDITVRLEEDREYWLGVPEGAGREHWFWNRLRHAELFDRNAFEVTVTTVQAPRGAGLARVDFQGKSTGGHHLRAEINGVVTSQIDWAGPGPWTAEFPAALLPGSNRLVLVPVASSEIDLLYLDRITVTYPGTLRLEEGRLDARGHSASGYVLAGAAPGITIVDASVPEDPALLLGVAIQDGVASFMDTVPGARYVAANPDGYLKPTIQGAPPVSLPDWNGANYVAIVPAPFTAAVTPLLEHHAARGLTTAIVDPEVLYAIYGHGEPTPHAIRGFLADLQASVAEPPLYVLLAGDATVDYRNLMGGAPMPSLPTLLVEHAGFGEVPSDDALVDVEGDDGIPEFAVGRLPGRTPEAVSRMVTRLLDYPPGSDPVRFPWTERVHLVTDDGNGQLPFEDAAENLALRIPDAYRRDRSYLRDLGSPEATSAAIRERFTAGSLLTVYIGHGNVTQWAAERIFHANDALALTNGARSPVVATLNCLNGYFADAEQPASLAEALLLAPSGGAAGVLAPSGIGYLPDETALAWSWLDAVFSGEARDLGEALILAKAAHASYPGVGSSRDLNRGYGWFGDPAQALALPAPAAPPSPRARGTVLGAWLTWSPTGARTRIWKRAGDGTPSLSADLDGTVDAWMDTTLLPPASYALQTVNISGFESFLSPWIEIAGLTGDGMPPAIALAAPESCARRRFTATVSDVDGVPCRDVEVNLDGTPLDPSQWSLTACPATGIDGSVTLRFLAEWSEGTHVLQVTAADGAGAQTSREVAIETCYGLRALGLAVSPNPAVGAARIEATWSVPARLEVAIHGLDGRRVRRLAGDASTSHSLTWDGLGEDGRPAASGVYYVILKAASEAASWTTSRRLVFLR